MALSVPLEDARAALVGSVGAVVDAVGALDELALLAASRCRGWTRLDVVVHVLRGWQEVLGGLASRTDDAPTVDAAGYWTAFARSAGDADPVAVLMAERRFTAAYARPSSAVAHLRDVAGALRRGVAAADGDRRVFQGDVLALGDFLATWAVEDVVHHLDLLVDQRPPAGAVALARATVEALAGGRLPVEDDVEAVLVGAGRVPVPDGWAAGLRSRLPVLG